ncbi:hypothetical protein Tco_1489821 [Tanacetum coccineum]
MVIEGQVLVRVIRKGEDQELSMFAFVPLTFKRTTILDCIRIRVRDQSVMNQYAGLLSSMGKASVGSYFHNSVGKTALHYKESCPQTFCLFATSCLSSDCSLQLGNMKLESLVIADQHAAVNMYPGPVHTARVQVT